MAVSFGDVLLFDSKVFIYRKFGFLSRLLLMNNLYNCIIFNAYFDSINR